MVAADRRCEFVRQLFLERDGQLPADPRRRRRRGRARRPLRPDHGRRVPRHRGASSASRFTRASPPRRRAMLPSVAGISALLLVGALATVVDAADRRLARPRLAAAGPGGVPRGLLRSRLARGGLSGLLGELRTLRGGELQARLAQAAGDPSLVVAYGRPDALRRSRRPPRRRRPRPVAGAARRGGADLRQLARRGSGPDRGGRVGGRDRARAHERLAGRAAAADRRRRRRAAAARARPPRRRAAAAGGGRDAAAARPGRHPHATRPRPRRG